MEKHWRIPQTFKLAFVLKLQKNIQLILAHKWKHNSHISISKLKQNLFKFVVQHCTKNVLIVETILKMF